MQYSVESDIDHRKFSLLIEFICPGTHTTENDGRSTKYFAGEQTECVSLSWC